MGEDKKKDIALVFDANVIIAGLISSSGINNKIAVFAPLRYRSFYPSTMESEVLKHGDIISEKSGISPIEVKYALIRILSYLRKVDEDKYVKFTREVIKGKLVNDESDAPYVATSLYLLRGMGYKKVVLITWNKKDYNPDELRKYGILVMTPPEFFKKYLKHEQTMNNQPETHVRKGRHRQEDAVTN